MLGLDNPIHILFLLIILLLVFGAKRLPEMGKSLGEGLRGFKESISGETATTHPTHNMTTTAAEPMHVVEHLPAAPAMPEPIREPVPEFVSERARDHSSMTPAA